MRLIDADLLKEKLAQIDDSGAITGYIYRIIADTIDETPTEQKDYDNFCKWLARIITEDEDNELIIQCVCRNLVSMGYMKLDKVRDVFMVNLESTIS